MLMIKPSCKDCIFWLRHGAEFSIGRGFCRFNAPAPVLTPDAVVEAHPNVVWPVTLETDWCGEFNDGQSAVGVLNHGAG